MFSTLLSLSSLLIALSSVSSTPIARDTHLPSLPIKGNVNIEGFRTIADADRARAAVLRSHGLGGHAKRDGNTPVLNNGVTYSAAVFIGNPPVEYTLLVDTGSSNTWVGAAKPYMETSSSQDTGDTVSVSYGSGSFSGKEFADKVTLSPDLVIEQQSIGVASKSQGLDDGTDGILGVGPVGLTAGTLSSGSLVPTITDNLHKQGTISHNSLSVFFKPVTDLSGEFQGELTFGGVDESKIVGNVNYVPITSTSPASEYWGIDQSISYGDSTILGSTAGIVDTGTTLILIASDAFATYQAQTGAVLDKTTGLLKISQSQLDNLKSLFFNVGQEHHELTPNAQIWPRALNTKIGGDAQSIYLIVADLGSNSGSGLDFINGYGFLERYYSVYDTSESRVGFAATPHTFAETN